MSKNIKSKYDNIFDKKQIKEKGTIFKNIVFIKNLNEKLKELNMTLLEYIELKQKAFYSALIASIFVFAFVQIWQFTFLILIAVIMVLMSFLAIDLYIADKDRLKQFKINSEKPLFLDTLT